MKKCLPFLFLLFIVPNLFAQKDGQVFLSYKKIENVKVNDNGTLNIHDNWKFHWGDNLKWKLPDDLYIM